MVPAECIWLTGSQWLLCWFGIRYTKVCVTPISVDTDSNGYLRSTYWRFYDVVLYKSTFYLLTYLIIYLFSYSYVSKQDSGSEYS